MFPENLPIRLRDDLHAAVIDPGRFLKRDPAVGAHLEPHSRWAQRAIDHVLRSYRILGPAVDPLAVPLDVKAPMDPESPFDAALLAYGEVCGGRTIYGSLQKRALLAALEAAVPPLRKQFVERLYADIPSSPPSSATPSA